MSIVCIVAKLVVEYSTLDMYTSSIYTYEYKHIGVPSLMQDE